MSRQKGYRLLRNLLILGSILAAIKLIFVDYTMDEEYQIVMAYRNLQGDTLFGTMWEPHQTSAFVCAVLLRLYTAITGTTTGVVLFLRGITTGIQLLFAVWMDRFLRQETEKEYAFLLACCYFNVVPKLIEIPEFSNLQLWGLTAVLLSLGYWRRNQRKLSWLAAAGLGMAVEVLAYPSDVILFPFFLVVIGLTCRQTDGRLLKPLIFGGTCVLCGILWLGAVFLQVAPEEFFRNIPYILQFDLTHDVTAVSGDKLTAIGADALRELIFAGISCAVAGLAGLIASKKSGKSFVAVFTVTAVLIAEGIQLFYWVILQKGYEDPQIHWLVVWACALLFIRETGEGKRKYYVGMAAGFLVFLSVLYMSDLSLFYAIPHGIAGIFSALLLLIAVLQNDLGRNNGRRVILFLLGSLCVVSVFGKGFVLRAGKTETNTVLGIGGIMKEGPAAGILTNYMQAYVNNCDYEDFSAYVEEGSSCLIVTNMVGTGGTSPYLFRNLSISHFSIVDPTSYDERLLTYWELYPEKVPDVIVVDCWYGQLMEPADNWIMQYIENDFGYTRVEDGRYVRFYFR